MDETIESSGREELANTKMFIGDNHTNTDRYVKMLLGIARMEMPLFLEEETLYFAEIVGIIKGSYRLQILDNMAPFECQDEKLVNRKQQECGANCRLFIRRQFSPGVQENILILLMTVDKLALPLEGQTVNDVMVKPGNTACSLELNFIKSRPAPENFHGKRADQIICAM